LIVPSGIKHHILENDSRGAPLKTVAGTSPSRVNIVDNPPLTADNVSSI
jgi:hypothetical protein